MKAQGIVAMLAAIILFAAPAAIALTPVRVLPNPILPVAHTSFAIVIEDRDRYPLAIPTVEIETVDPTPYHWWSTSTSVAGATVLASLPEGLPAGRYWVNYYEQRTSYADSPKVVATFVVSPSGPVRVVEYFSPVLDEFFLASDPDEINLLDSGTVGRWVRTGESFRAFPPSEIPEFGVPVCRYYGVPAAGLDAHFFSADPGECANLGARSPRSWVLESRAAFGAIGDVSPVPCEAAMVRLYRLFDGTKRHRYTIHEATRDRMIAQGWTLEAGRSDGGGGPYSMCVLVPQ